jgi:multidrug transporter EmrE-like cation transporter
MIPLAISTLFSAGFTIFIRLAQKRGANLTAVGAVNYLTAALFHASFAVAAGLRIPHGESLAIGGVGGIAYAAAFFLLHGFMKKRGMSVSAAVTRLSVIVPVGVSVLAWGETASVVQTVGIALAMVSLPLLSIGPRSDGGEGTGEKPRRGRTRGIGPLAGLFVVNGLCMLVPRAFNQTGIRGEDAIFLFVLFAAASLSSGTVWIIQERRFARRVRFGTAPAGDPRPALLASVLPGVAVGLCNAVASRFIVIALQKLPGIVVYPFYSAVGLLLTVVFSWMIWKERISALEAAGMAFALGSIVLVNLV